MGAWRFSNFLPDTSFGIEMPAVSATAPGKVILFGEHAVVYGQPAIAVPVLQVRAKVTINADPMAARGNIEIDAPDIRLKKPLDELASDHPFVLLFDQLKMTYGVTLFPAMRLRIKSTIPIASGLGSGTAVSVAIIRAVSTFVGNPLSLEQISAIAFEIEKKYHGTPSGIDNTVVTYAQPVYFIRQEPIEVLPVLEDFTLVIADSGMRSKTSIAVGHVREKWEHERQQVEDIFNAIGEISHQARNIIRSEDPQELGSLMNENHALLVKLGVSNPRLDDLVAQAIQSGAAGAKLSGAGEGGNVIALVKPEIAQAVAESLQKVGAVRTIITTITKTK
jgi:mevalonate kinase